MLRWYKQVSGERQSDTSTAFKLLGQVRARTALSLIRFIKIIFSSCLSKARSKAVQFSHKRLYSVFNIARTAYTNRYVLIIWKQLFESIALLKPRFNSCIDRQMDRNFIYVSRKKKQPRGRPSTNREHLQLKYNRYNN